jgi:hypothetical protein
MTAQPEHDEVATAMRAIDQAWLGGRVDEIGPAVHPEIVMALPGFSGEVRGRERFVGGFRDFVQNATVEDYRPQDQQIAVVGNTAVVTFTYQMLYARAGARYRVTGRDLWVFQKQGPQWIAVWRTMMDLSEAPV